MVMAADAGLVAFSSDAGEGVKGVTITLTGIGVGATEVTFMTFNGTCPPATHAYPVTVSADYGGLLKDFDKLAKDELKDFRVSNKLSFGTFASMLKQLAVEYEDGALDDDGLHFSFHTAASSLRQGCQFAGWMAYTNVIGGGTQMLDTAAAEFGDAPLGLFAGGCGPFDRFQDSVCGDCAKFHATFDKASKKDIKAFEKLGAPVFGPWNSLPPLDSGGPLYPAQATAVTPPQVLAGPYTITIGPASGVKGGNGRLLVSGLAASALSGQFEVLLTREEDGQAPTTATVLPPVVNDEWLVSFVGLDEGAYTLSTMYTGDLGRVDVPIHIPFDF